MRPIIIPGFILAVALAGCGGGGGGAAPVTATLGGKVFDVAKSSTMTFASASTPTTILYGHGQTAGQTSTFSYAASTVQGVPTLRMTWVTTYASPSPSVTEWAELAKSTDGAVYTLAYHSQSGSTVGWDWTVGGPGQGAPGGGTLAVSPALTFLPTEAVGPSGLHAGLTWLTGGLSTQTSWGIDAVGATTPSGDATGATELDFGTGANANQVMVWFVPGQGVVESYLGMGQVGPSPGSTADGYTLLITGNG